jgi:hypothetical protein
MSKKWLTGVSAVALLAGTGLLARPASAELITFDDLAPCGSCAIANGYAGLDWTNWDYLTGADLPFSGYDPGTVSKPNVAFNGFGAEAIFSDNTFTLNSAYMTAAWRDNLSVTVTGLLNNVVVDTKTFLLSATTPTLETFGWSGINKVELTATGGTKHVGYTGTGTQVAVDNLLINAPEPGTLALLGAGLAGLGVVRRRRKPA